MSCSIDGVYVPVGKVVSRDSIGASSSPGRESASGAIAVPAGGRYSLNYNEYIVYSREQVRAAPNQLPASLKTPWAGFY